MPRKMPRSAPPTTFRTARGVGSHLRPALALPEGQKNPRLPRGQVAETQLHRMPVLLHRRSDGFELFVPRSFAASFEDWIVDAAMETG